MTDLFGFEEVSIAFDGVAALRRVSASLPVGKLSVIAGASGSGKSTLLRLCNRLEVPTAGRVRFRGTDVMSLDPLQLRRHVGMVFQRPTVFAGTVRDNLLVADPAATDEQLAGTLTMAELDDTFLSRNADDLSGGEAQRVCLARTLACRPDVLLMDEPTASLHPAASMALERTVQGLQHAGTADIVWVTHDLDQIERLAEFLLVLERGSVLYAGNPASEASGNALDTLSGNEAH